MVENAGDGILGLRTGSQHLQRVDAFLREFFLNPSKHIHWDSRALRFILLDEPDCAVDSPTNLSSHYLRCLAVRHHYIKQR